jgi:hypothetical protein
MVFQKSPEGRLKNGSNYWRKKDPIFPDPMPMFYRVRFENYESHSVIMNIGCYTLSMAKRS